VVKLIFEKYGQEHCAVVGGFSPFQAQALSRKLQKVLGVAEREVPQNLLITFRGALGRVGAGWADA